MRPTELIQYLEQKTPGLLDSVKKAQRGATQKKTLSDTRIGPLASIEDRVLAEAAKRAGPLETVIRMLQDASYDRLSLAVV